MDPFVVTEFRQVEIPKYVGHEHSAGTYLAPEIQTLQEEREQIPPGKLAVRQGADVRATDGKVGRADELLVDSESGRITHLVMRAGHLWGQKDVILPISVIDKVFEETVYLKLDRQTIASMLAIPAKQHFGLTDVELVILILDEPGKAAEVLKTLNRFASEKFAEEEINPVLNAARLIKDEDGKTSIKEFEDVGARHGALFGAISGGLIGLFAGPVGVVVGAAAGAVTGGAAARWIDMGFPDEYLKKLQAGLQPGSSAIVALVEQAWAGQVTELLADFEGQLLRQALTEAILAQLMIEDKAPGGDAGTD